MLIMLRKHKIKSCKCAKSMFKTESYTENKPKVYQIYIECWTGSKSQPPLCKEVSPLQQRGEEASPHCRETTPLQQGDALSVFT